MGLDLAAATAFLAAHGRVLDRRRFDLLTGGDDRQGVLAALDAYRNKDGSYGWGLEPDLRERASQPIHALHVFDVVHECAPLTTPRSVELCDWLAGVAFDDGTLPFVLPIKEPAACAPWFLGADPNESSLHGTVAVLGAAWRAAAHDPAIAAHPWLERATASCLDRLASEEKGLSAYELVFALCMLDALADRHPTAPDLLDRLASTVPASGVLPVEGGVEGEALRPLDYAPTPDSRVRRYVSTEAVDADLDRVATGQCDDGGWTVDFPSFSPAAALEWRGDATVRAVSVLVANGRA